MNLLTVFGRRGVVLGCAMVTLWAITASPVHAAARSDAMASGASSRDQSVAQSVPASALLGVATTATPATSTTIGASTQAAVSSVDSREMPFPRGWILALLAVCALVLSDRLRIAIKNSKLSVVSRESSALAGPLVRN
jgi:hypothetical protein